MDRDFRELIQALKANTDAVNALANATANLADAVVSALDVSGEEEAVKALTYLDGARVG